MAGKKLVVDTSIASSAGGEDATYPTSINCRDTLKTILKAGHLLVLTPEITEEWKKHRSQFASEWLSQMYARKLVFRLVISDSLLYKFEALKSIPVEIAQGGKDAAKELHRLEALNAIHESHKEAMLKDCLLIDAALATDKTILAEDNKARGYFSRQCSAIGEIKLIIWRHPDESDVITWLENDAPSEKHLRLESYQPVSNPD